MIDELASRWRGPLAAAGRPLHLHGTGGSARASSHVAGEALDVLLQNALTHGAGPVSVTMPDAGQLMAIDVTGTEEHDRP